jgi:hypothetical protein
VDVLYTKEKIRKEEKERKNEQWRKIQSERESHECTHTPQINHSNVSSFVSTSSTRYLNLYNKVPVGSIALKTNKTAE